MKRLTMTLLVTLALFSAVGCSAVLVEEPIGAVPVRIEPDEWEGYWIGHASDEDEPVVGRNATSFWLRTGVLIWNPLRMG